MAKRYVERPLAKGGKIYTEARGDGQGAFEVYRPAQHTKPQQKGLLRRILSAFKRAFTRVDPATTTEQGSASAASPSTYGFTLLAGRYERRAMIADCREMIENDPRARRSTLKFAREACRGGVRIILNKDANKGLSEASMQIAQDSVDRVRQICNRRLVVSWAWMLLVEGDCFVQWVMDGDNVIKAKRMPAVSMERLSDDTDEFIDPRQAFSQLDTVTQQTIATFPEPLISHARWCHIDGERYGHSEIATVRRTRRLIELLEESQAVRRMSRASNPRLWTVGSAEEPGEYEEVKKFKDENGMIEGRMELFDPQNVARDVFGNGLVDMKVVPGDSTISDITDLKYLQNIYTSAGLPWPAMLYGLDSESVNRDVLEDLRAEALKETQELSDCVGDIIRGGLELDMLMHDILPETVHIDIHFSESNIETPEARTNRIIMLRKNATADFRPDPLLTLDKTIQLLAEDLDITDIPAYIMQLEAEKKAAFAQTLKQQEQQTKMQVALQPQSGGEGAQGEPDKPAKPNNGNGKNGADHAVVRPLVATNGRH